MSQIAEAIARWCAFARAGNWWFSKIPPLLTVSYLTILMTDTDPRVAAVLIGCYVFSVSSVAIYGHVINDIFDVETDLQAGRRNAMTDVPQSMRVLLAVIFLCAGFLPALIVHYPLTAFLLLGANYLWPTIYSVPGFRLKERGLLGVICDALGSHITPTLLGLVLFGAFELPAPIRRLYPLIITVWATALGIKGILHHQVLDHEADTASGTSTFAIAAGPDAIKRFMTEFNLLVELPASAALVFLVVPWCPLAAVALAVYCALETIKYTAGFQFALSHSIRASVPFANEMFYTLWMPMAAALQLAARGPAWLWLPVVHFVLFRDVFAAQASDLKSVAANLRQSLIR